MNFEILKFIRIFCEILPNGKLIKYSEGKIEVEIFDSANTEKNHFLFANLYKNTNSISFCRLRSTNFQLTLTRHFAKLKSDAVHFSQPIQLLSPISLRNTLQIL